MIRGLFLRPMFGRVALMPSATLVTAFFPFISMVQEPVPQRPTLRAVAVEEPIAVDGALGDEAWTRAEVGGGFVQREPAEGKPATEPTEIRVAYNTATLYIAVRCLDSEPTGIVAQEMRRDRSLIGDDNVVVLLDTFRDRRNAYLFEINPNGALRDSLLTDEGRDVNLAWDGIWWGAARRTADGWTAELAIPFSTLQFDPGLDTWGLNVRRVIRRKNEETYWSPVFLDANVRRVSLAGSLNGLRTPSPGLDLRAKPFVVGSDTSGPQSLRDAWEGDVGLDVQWSVTRRLTLNLTANTDFAETEVDALQVNLTRFSLFFPEKREFFLENAGIFDYGPGFSVFGAPLLRVFHSRRIGVGPGGEPVPIDWGARLTGRVGDWSLGLLHTGTERTDLRSRPVTVPGNDWSVVRLKRNLGRRSNMGMIFTGREGGGDRNRVYGLDANVNPTQSLNLNAFLSVSDDPGPDSNNAAAGFGTAWTGSRWLAGFEAQEIQEGYNPEVGFLLRRGVRRYSPDLHYLPRPNLTGVRNLDFQVLGQVITDLDDQIETVSTSATLLGARFKTDDFLSLFYDWNLERLHVPFEIVPGVAIPAAEHRFDALGIYFSTSAGRRASLDGFVRYGDFFDGRQYDHEVKLQFRPSGFFGVETLWNHNDVDLPGGSFVVDIVRQRLSVSLNPRVSLDTFLQYNLFSDLFSMNLRLNWIYKPGADLFVVYNYNGDAPGFPSLATRDRQTVVKLTYLVGL